MAGKKRQFKAKMVRFAPIRANQITGTTSDFKMGVIERGIALVHEVILFRFYVTITTIVKLSQSFQQNHFHLLKSQKQKKGVFQSELEVLPCFEMNYKFLERDKKTSFASDNEKARKFCEHGPEIQPNKTKKRQRKKCQGRLPYIQKRK